MNSRELLISAEFPWEYIKTGLMRDNYANLKLTKGILWKRP